MRIPADSVELEGTLEIPERAIGVVLFAHGSGSSRLSPRNVYVAAMLRQSAIGTLLFDLLTEDEAQDRQKVFDVNLLAERLLAATEWVRQQDAARGLSIGYFGASTGAAAALIAAATDPAIDAVVSRGGRPDLAGRALLNVNGASHASGSHRAEPIRAERPRPDAARSADWRTRTRSVHCLYSPEAIAKLIGDNAERIDDIHDVDIEPLLKRVGDARVVLLGEATHGTSEFYRMRARITKDLISRKGFKFVAVESDWPDAARINQYIGHAPVRQEQWKAFARFPTWMWRNQETLEMVEWLRAWNGEISRPECRVSFHGLDLYSLFTSIDAVITYLNKVDPRMAATARERYGCLTPWQLDPVVYGRAVLSGKYQDCEAAVLTMLGDLLNRQIEYSQRDGDKFFDALQNARLVADAERYYRIMYYGSVDSWNLRDHHMFETLQRLLDFHGPGSKGVVWAHNSHVGNAAFTEMGARSEFNIGQLSRLRFGDSAFLIGFGTDDGTVAASSEWDGPMELKQVRPSHEASYERLCHDSRVAGFTIHLREPRRQVLREALMAPRLERAIGVIYRPESELMSHYFEACLPLQFDEFIWFDGTHAVTPLPTSPAPGLPETYPFGV